jgi:hypothetical protein
MPDKIKARKLSPIYQQQNKKSFSMAKNPCFLSLASPRQSRPKSPHATIPREQRKRDGEAYRPRLFVHFKLNRLVIAVSMV